MFNLIMGTFLVVAGMILYVDGYAQLKSVKPLNFTMADLPAGQYNIEATTDEVIIRQDGVVKKKYLKAAVEA